MRSIIKFIIYTLTIILLPSLVMIAITSISVNSFILLLLGQLIVIFLLVSFYFLSRKIINKYEEDTLKMIENEKDVEILKNIREKRISYKSKANITKRILDIDFSKKECQKLRKYSSSYEDNVFYYSSLIQNDREGREEHKKRRNYFNKRYKNKNFVFVDFNENLKTSIKWILIFLISSFISITNPFRIVENVDLYALLILLNFAFNLALVINTIIWIIRSLKAYWIKELV
ncbi:hypothetical protein FYJ26_09910 [Anaerococcus sp. WCA-380-WT-2B]|uniref:Uncharacterized protein n=1 Tax=Anaerococcus porci TaxID=2652269 RepID=A0A6N7VUX2_9FIRM|nr:hypothetical protein [Anaerococcus porci]MSS78692.1 hypothetical protein [Anaerococcus porci]